MPGIVGLITKMPQARAEAELLRMVEALRHESFYEYGTFIDKELGVYAGWVARRNSFSDGMPVRNERGDVTLIFAGEEFSEPETAQRLKNLGHSFDPEGPEYLVHLYEEDQAFPAGLNGRFQGLVVDQRRKMATLFNDRYGMHRLYSHQAADAFYFGAEAKAILAVRPELRSVDDRGLGEFIACGCVLENRTIFTGIETLPPAAAWVFRRGAIDREGSYFHPGEWEQQETLDPESYYKELRKVFWKNLPRYFEGRERIGVSLTGGLDTRMVLAWRKSAPGMLPCYTFGGPYRDSQDVTVARRVARLCRQPHQVIQLGEDFLSRFAHYAERTVYLTDGTVDAGHSPDLYLNELAREIAPVRMTGNYGGEILRRVRAFKPEQPLPGLLQPELLAHVDAAGQTYAGLIREHPLSFAAFRQAPWHHFGLAALEQTQVSVRSPYLDNEFVRTVYRAPQSTLNSNEVSLRLIEDGDPKLRRVRTDRDAAGNGLGAAALRGWLEFTFKAEYAYNHGMPQWLARIDHALTPFHLERLFLGRHKFSHFRIWYRDQLAGYVREILLDPRTLSRPWIERRRLESIVAEHLTGRGNHTNAIHKLLTLELLHRLCLERGQGARPSISQVCLQS